MMRKYFLRLDDAGAYMDLQKWNKAIQILDDYNVKSCIAVIPNCDDPDLLQYGYVEEWKKIVLDWSRRHEIALHGHTHKYEYFGKSKVRVRPDSEFAGAPLETQKKKIESGLLSLRKMGLTIRYFVAPGHSFDKRTLQVLASQDLIVYDGFFPRPVIRNGLRFFPLHIASLRDTLGYASMCLHPNTMTEVDFARLNRFLRDKSGEIGDVNEVEYTNLTVLDLLFHCLLNNLFKLKYFVRNITV